MIRFYSLLFMLAFAASGLVAQQDMVKHNNFCRHELTAAEQQRLADFKASNHQANRAATNLVPITIHLVGNDDGSGRYSLENALKTLCKLNQDMAASDFFFWLYDIRYHNNTLWNTGGWNNHGAMYNATRLPNTYNSYIVTEAGDVTYPVCGYFGGGVDGVVLDRSCVGANSTTWAHETGHYFGLPHTFVGWEGDDYSAGDVAPNWAERANGSNCNFAADEFCDTRADYLSYRWNCTIAGESAFDLTDATGATFKADGTNYMSYSDDACMTSFSTEQINYMSFVLNGGRSNLLTLAAPSSIDTIIDAPVLTAPMADDTLVYNAVTLEWDPSPGATKYWVLISTLPTFSIQYEEAVVTGTSYTPTSLQPDKRYYYRVLPYNDTYFCAPRSSNRRFYTKNTTVANNQIPTIVSGLSVGPNPALSGSNLNIQIDLVESSNTTIQLLDATGRTIVNTQEQLNQGSNLTYLPLSDISGGIYLLQIRTEQGDFRTEKVLVLD